MKKFKQTPIPLPGEKPKSKPPTPAKAKSSEFVDSSDDSSHEPQAPQPKPTKKPAKSTNIAVHKPPTNGVTKTMRKPPSKPTQATQATQKSTAAPKKQVRREEEASSSSSEESDHDDGAQNGDVQREQPTKSTGNARSGSAESSGSSSEEEPAPEVTQGAATQQSNATQSHTVEFRPAQPYVPPKNFVPAAIPHRPSPTVQMFENLEGKQVWHITAPADVPIRELKELALDQALNGEAILNYKGADYGFPAVDKSDQGTKQVLIPRKGGYKPVSARISKRFHLQQVLRLPKLSSKQADPNTGSAAAASITRSSMRAPRPQAKGLKMRYFPSGSGEHEPMTIGPSDSEGEDQPQAAAGLAVPNTTHVAQRPEKRKHDGVDDGADGVGSPPAKKHRPHKTADEIRRRQERRAKKAKAQSQ